MAVTKDQAQALCTPTEWKTVVNSFDPKLSELGSNVAKKNANRITRFLQNAESEGDSKRADVMKEALERLEAVSSDSKDADKQSARRKKEKESHKKRQEQRVHRAEVREKLQQKAEEEKAEKEKAEKEKAGDSEDSEEPEVEAKEKKAKGVRARLKAAAAAGSGDK